MKLEQGVFTVLYVCTGNLCRSPMAEGLLRETLRHRRLLAEPGADTGWQVRSAGTHAVTGRPMEPGAVSALADLGIDGSSFRSTPLDAAAIAAADLVLTAERRHRSAVVTLWPVAIRYTFTMRQFAHLLRSAPALSADATGADLVALAAARRSRVQALNPTVEDVPDPIGKPLPEFRTARDRILRTVAGALAPLPLAHDS